MSQRLTRFVPDADVLDYLGVIPKQMPQREGTEQALRTAPHAQLPDVVSSTWLFDLWRHVHGSHPTKQSQAILDFLAMRPTLSFSWFEEEPRKKRLLCHASLSSSRPANARTLVGLVMSRLGKNLDEKSDLFQKLRLACAAAKQSDYAVLTAENSAGSTFVTRCCEHVGTALCKVVTYERTDANGWLESVARHSCKEVDGSFCDFIYVSPQIHFTNQKHEIASKKNEYGQSLKSPPPLHDRVVDLLSDQLWVLGLRKDGNWHSLIDDRLRDARTSGTIRIIDVEPGMPHDLVDQLQSNGAVRWYLAADNSVVDMGEEPMDRDHQPREVKNAKRRVISSTKAFIHRLERDEELLTHWTRRADGPWPEETNESFLDGHIFSEDTDRSAFGTLCRILDSNKLIGSANGIRSSKPVVSFSAVPLPELIAKRRFQTHRQRWDFEHYGFCCPRHVLLQHGAQPVRYGEESDWQQMTPEEQPWFQIAQSRTKTRTIDWSEEQEWRILGDLQLVTIPSTAGFVFTATTREATLLVDRTRFHVISVEELSRWQDAKPKN